MNVPANFNKVKNLSQTISEIYNKFVKEEFKDVSDDDFEDFNKPRSVLRYCSLVQPSDSLTAIVLRFMLFYMVLRKARDLQQPFYAIPIGMDEEQRKYKPQISLYFAQDWSDVEENENRVEGIVSFRLMDEKSTTITKTQLTEIAREIKTQFGAAGKGYLWQKGKDLASYTDWENGYQLQLLVKTKTDAKEIVEKVLSIRDKNPDWKKFQYKVNEEPTEAYPLVRGKQTILNKSYDKPRLRPVEKVRFQYALAHLHGVGKPFVLYDVTGTFFDPLVE